MQPPTNNITVEIHNLSFITTFQSAVIVVVVFVVVVVVVGVIVVGVFVVIVVVCFNSLFVSYTAVLVCYVSWSLWCWFWFVCPKLQT